jgi:hypothetical protein
MLTPLTGKDKAARVPLNYFRQPRRGRKAAIIGALGVAGIALVVSLASGYWRDLASPGPLNMVHSAWDNDCSVCHRTLEPASSRNGLQNVLGTREVADELCIHCHAGTPHHPHHVKGKPPSCASCHIEHRGRTANLSKVPDSTCTACHADLSAHTQDGTTDYANKITRFDRDHPQFRLGERGKRQELGKAIDPGKLRFNHAAHLREGVRLADKDAGGWKLGNIKDKVLRERYRQEQPEGKGREDKDFVQLECSSCHQLDSTDAPKTSRALELMPRASGEYMMPVNYDQHCKACHPLTFDPALPDVQIPHHLQPEDVRRFLWGVFASQEAKAIEKKVSSDRPLPGLNVSSEEARRRIRPKVGTIESFLFQTDVAKAAQFVFTGQTTCGLCHYYESKPGEQIPLRIVPPNIPQLWYPHGKFSHYAHRAVDCTTCHDAKNSTTSTDVLLPGVENCKECHSRRRVVDGETLGGVRQDCTTCHRYHQGDVPEAGLGAKARGPKSPRSIQDFLAPEKSREK